MPCLPPNQQRQSTEGKFLITPTLLTTGNRYRPLKKIAICKPMVTSMRQNSVLGAYGHKLFWRKLIQQITVHQ